MGSGSSQPKSRITVSNQSTVGVINTGGYVNIEGNLIVQSSSQESDLIKFALPRLITTFRGRELEIQTLDTLFFTQKKNKVVICGLPGFGKSELSKQYANICLKTKKIDKTFWINCETIENSLSCLEYIYEKFKKYKVLFIFDNGLSRQDIFNYEPPENVKYYLLITSQEKDWGDDVESLKLVPLSPASAVNVFQSILNTNYKDEDQDLYEELADVVGNVPLGLQIIGAYIRLRIKSLGNGFKLEEYIILLKETQETFIDAKLPKFAANTYAKSILGAIKISVEKIRDEEDSEMRDLALNVLCTCCFLHPEWIYLDNILSRRNINEILATITDKNKLNFAINMLDNYMFLDYNHDNKQITIHRFTQEILQFYLGKSDSQLQMNCFCSCIVFTSIDACVIEGSEFFHLFYIFGFINNNTNIISTYCSNHMSENDEIFNIIIFYGIRFGFQECLIKLFEDFGDYTKNYIIKNNLLYFPIRANRLHILELLVQYVDVNSTSDIYYNGQNIALHTAASKRNVNAIKILIEHKADTSLRNEEGNTPIFTFMESYQEDDQIDLDETIEICELLNCENNKNILNNEGHTLMYIASSVCQNAEVLNLLLQHGLDVNSKNENLDTPLHAASLHWNLVAIKFLVERKADLHAKNCKGETALFPFVGRACNYKSINVDEINEIFELLKLKEDRNIADNKGNTLMHITAALCQNTELLNLLLQHGLNMNSKNEKQATPLHTAAFHWNLSALKFLITKNANINAKTNDGKTPLFYFIEGAGLQNIINLDEVYEILELLQCNENKDITTTNNNTLLCAAAISCHEKLVLLFFTKYNIKNINHQDLLGNTPLHNVIIYLVYKGSRTQKDVIRTVKVLKKCGARLDIKNEDGKTPFQIAQEMGLEFLLIHLTETVSEDVESSESSQQDETDNSENVSEDDIFVEPLHIDTPDNTESEPEYINVVSPRGKTKTVSKCLRCCFH